jgi:predicted regulator of Ras-like GTPase activity (Roadblock/LC7/MglB family)
MNLVEDIISTVTRTSVGPAAAKEDALNTIVHDLVEDTSDIVGALVTSLDGVPKAQRLPPGFDARRFSAMSSALLALSSTMAREAGKGETVNVLIEGKEGNTYVLHAGDQLVLTVFTTIKPNLGLTLAHARRAADRVVVFARERAGELAGLT